MRILVYAGINQGDNLHKYIDLYDLIITFEPDPDTYSIALSRFRQYNHVIFVNAALSEEEGTMKLFIPPHKQASSLAEISKFSVENGFSGGSHSTRQIDVRVLNLCNFLKELNINYIDCLITDCQGSDLTILKTVKNFIDEGRIKEIICETHDNGIELYDGLDNQFSGFKELLEEKYEIKDYYFNGNVVGKDVSPHAEWDIHWVLK